MQMLSKLDALLLGIGVGMLVAALLIKLAGVGALLGVALVGFALAPALWVAMPLAAVIGFGLLIYMVLNNGLIISSAEARFHGRVTSVNTLRFSVTPLAVLAATSLTDAIGAQPTVAIGGVIVVVTMLALMRLDIEIPS